jgi:hypothetical protein
VPIEVRTRDASARPELLGLPLTALCDAVRRRNDSILKNLVLRHQLAVLTRTGRRPKLRAQHRLLRVVAGLFCLSWHRPLVFIRPGVVIRHVYERAA